MSSVEQGYAAWLKGETLTVTAIGDMARWPLGAKAGGVTAFATKPGAMAEAARRLALTGTPYVRDIAVLPGLRRDLIGRCVMLVSDNLDYVPGGNRVFIVAVAEQENGTTIATVLRKL